MIAEKFGNMRSGDDDPPIDVERFAVEPGFAQQVGHRQPLANASAEQTCDAPASRGAYRHARFGIEGQAQASNNEDRRFVPRIGGAVAVVQARGTQASRRVAQQLPQGQGRSARNVSR